MFSLVLPPVFLSRPLPPPRNSIWNRRAFPAYTAAAMETTPHSAPGANDGDSLIVRVAQGDREAFGALYDRFSMPLYSLALKILGDEAEAKDLLQDIFLSIWHKAPGFRAERGTAFSWMVTLLRNRAIDRIRSRRRRSELLDANAPDLEPTSSATPTSAQEAIASERAREVRAALEQINDEQRQVLRLAYFEGLTQVEIAEKLEEPLGTIKARAQRGMARLRNLLRGIHE